MIQIGMDKFEVEKSKLPKYLCIQNSLKNINPQIFPI